MKKRRSYYGYKDACGSILIKVVQTAECFVNYLRWDGFNFKGSKAHACFVLQETRRIACLVHYTLVISSLMSCKTLKVTTTYTLSHVALGYFYLHTYLLPIYWYIIYILFIEIVFRWGFFLGGGIATPHCWVRPCYPRILG